jgi:hypothetical protein
VSARSVCTDHRERPNAGSLGPIRLLHDLAPHLGDARATGGIHPKVVSERLGHATTAITLDIFSHVQPELDPHAATVVAELFGDKNKGTKAARRG